MVEGGRSNRGCQYENSLDGQFLIDYHPEYKNILIMGGSSGHGFKMSPALGEMVATHFFEEKPLLLMGKLPKIWFIVSQISNLFYPNWIYDL